MKTTLIVIGSLSTDIVATGLRRFANPGEYVFGKNLMIGPGGKSRNIADMAARLMGRGEVAMIGRTTKDAYGLWKVPMEALHISKVNTNFIVVDEKDALPSIALIAVDEQGNNQIIVLPGASNNFNKEDVDKADGLFDAVAKNKGYVAVTLECPFETASHAINKAKAKGCRVIFDPGGIDESTSIELLLDGLFLIKPNEHEAKTITGVEVCDFDSAKQAASILQQMGAENALITVGAKGAYLFTADRQQHIPIPVIQDQGVRDETGCGDQVMATLCAYLQRGTPIERATQIAILSGTLQFQRQGIQPVMPKELSQFL